MTRVVQPAEAGLRRAVAGSVIAHVLLIAALLVVRPPRSLAVPGADVVQVALVEAPPSPAAAPPAPSPVPAATEEVGVRIEKSHRPPPRKPQPAREAPQPKPTATPAPPAPQQVVLPAADIGSGMRGDVAVDASNFEFAYFLQQVRSLVAHNWSPIAGVPAGTRAVVFFRVGRTGNIIGPRVETSSGNAYFDQAALRAVVVTARVLPLPAGFDDLGVHFGFEYTGP